MVVSENTPSDHVYINTTQEAEHCPLNKKKRIMRKIALQDELRKNGLGVSVLELYKGFIQAYKKQILLPYKLCLKKCLLKQTSWR